MRRPFVVSLFVHLALVAAAATVWRTHIAPRRNEVVLTVAPADHPPAPDPPPARPPQPTAPSFDEEEIPFPETVAAPDVPFVAPPAPLPHSRAVPRVVRLGCSLRPTPTPPRPAPPPVHRVKPPPTPTPTRAVKVRGPTHGPVLMRSVARAPEYPRRARRLGHEGCVVLLIHVAADGAVARVAVESSSGFESLDTAAVRAAKRWRFRPALADGRPVAATLRRAIRFRLDA